MKALIIVGICLLTIYAPIELTWVIIVCGLIEKIWDIPTWQYILELCFMWIAYLGAIVVLAKVIKGRK